MKQLCTLAFALMFSLLCAQRTGGSSGNSYVAFEAGLTNFNPWKLNDYGNGQSYRDTRFYTYGLSFTGPVAGRYSDFADGTIAFHMFAPNWIEWYTDTSSLTERGWELMTSLYGFDLISTQRVDFVVGPGVYWGQLKLIEDSRGGGPYSHRYRNTFVAPMGRVDFRVTVGRIAIGARASFRYDITGSTWKNKDGGRSLPGYRFREGQYMIYIGWLNRQS